MKLMFGENMCKDTEWYTCLFKRICQHVLLRQLRIPVANLNEHTMILSLPFISESIVALTVAFDVHLRPTVEEQVTCWLVRKVLSIEWTRHHAMVHLLNKLPVRELTHCRHERKLSPHTNQIFKTDTNVRPCRSK